MNRAAELVLLTAIYIAVYNLIYTQLYALLSSLRRCPLVAEVKRIMISLPDNLLREVDGIVAAEKLNRSEFIREAMKLYIRERKRRTIREQMKKGYMEMAKINLALAGENFALEHEVSELFDGRLTGDE